VQSKGNEEEFVVGEFVRFSHSAFLPVNHTRILLCFPPQPGTPHFLNSDPVISRTRLEQIPKQNEQDIYPGNDGHEDAPIGCFVTKCDLTDMV
jgi:hypothetical protein